MTARERRSFKRTIGPAEIIPKWYGVAYPIPCSMRYACYPIPLNVVIGWARKLLWTVIGMYSVADVEQWAHDAYDRGVRDGRAIGFKWGVESQRKAVNKIVDAVVEHTLDCMKEARNGPD